DALGGEAKRLLRGASVFGQRFARGGVLALMGASERPSLFDECLGELAARELVQPVDDGGADRHYRFCHALVRDAAYAMLTDEDRRLGHRLAADYLAARSQSDAAVLAGHYDIGG